MTRVTSLFPGVDGERDGGGRAAAVAALLEEPHPLGPGSGRAEAGSFGGGRVGVAVSQLVGVLAAGARHPTAAMGKSSASANKMLYFNSALIYILFILNENESCYSKILLPHIIET